MRRHHLLLLGTILLAPSTALAVPAYTITDLGTLGGDSSQAFGINNSGQVTGGSTIANGRSRAFIWDRATGMQDLGTLGGDISSIGTGINDSGQVTGESTTADRRSRAFIWGRATDMQDLGTLSNGSTAGNGINDIGQVTGFSETAGGRRHAFVWDRATGIRNLGTLPDGFSSTGIDINNSGQVTGSSTAPSPNEDPIQSANFAILWDSVTGMQNLGTIGRDPSADFSIGTGINDSGQVTGGSNFTEGNFETHAFLWDPVTGMRDLGTLPNRGFNVGNGINASGQVTGLSGGEPGVDIDPHAFLWDGMSMLDLNDLIDPGSGWNLFTGNGINDAGQITGSGIIGGQTHAFVLTPIAVSEVPEPGALALMGSGIIGLGLLRRRKCRTDTTMQSLAS